jgi:hypothetical protein
MASLKVGSLTRWPIRGLERSQSNTYMPLIYSVSDDFTIEFPPGYEDTFNHSIQNANSTLRSIGMKQLPFKNFREFQVQLKHSLKQVTGSTSMKPNTHFDNHYHLKPDVQEEIINGVDVGIDSFMHIFIENLGRRLRGNDCILHPVAIQRVERKKWHWIDADGIGNPFSDENSEKINHSKGKPVIITPEGSKFSYTIDPIAKKQTNNTTGQVRDIALMGGRKRTKRRKSGRKRTRR